jgi:two-component system sensor histidine kinase AlgZ
MPETRSINQNLAPKLLPDFRNLGTVLRIVLLANGIVLLGAVAQTPSFPALQNTVLHGSVLLQPVLLSSLLVLYGLNSVLAREPYWRGALVVAIVTAAITLLFDMVNDKFLMVMVDADGFNYSRHVLVSAAIALMLLSYFRLRIMSLSPAKQEARLQALQARIRPHFLFNTINAVLSIVRADPKRAETALEDMADLFRMAMTEPHELVELSKEVQLARQYLELEGLRLGERLKVEWNTGNMPADALIPPLILQPLLENAVYHGIEPQSAGGTIAVTIYRDDGELHLEVRNPAKADCKPREEGNKMALSNIRERLALLFDVEAQYEVECDENQYRVHILIPYITNKAIT